ncbi:MAG: hypothetical protein NT018_13755 [Armatimonadetes bacterium]|nr:hypothetical protein [Armatimonadota bacterium]
MTTDDVGALFMGLVVCLSCLSYGIRMLHAEDIYRKNQEELEQSKEFVEKLPAIIRPLVDWMRHSGEASPEFVRGSRYLGPLYVVIGVLGVAYCLYHLIRGAIQYLF